MKNRIDDDKLAQTGSKANLEEAVDITGNRDAKLRSRGSVPSESRQGLRAVRGARKETKDIETSASHGEDGAGLCFIGQEGDEVSSSEKIETRIRRANMTL